MPHGASSGSNTMYICICNALTEKQVDEAIASGADSAGSVYEHHACAPRCGKCVRDVKERLKGEASHAQGGALPLIMQQSSA